MDDTEHSLEILRAEKTHLLNKSEQVLREREELKEEGQRLTQDVQTIEAGI